jgi:hypothetical protein
MELVRCVVADDSYDKGALAGVDLVPSPKSPREQLFCENFAAGFNNGRAVVWFKKDKAGKYWLIFKCLDDLLGERRLKISKNERLLSLLLSGDYITKVFFENGGYNAACVRFIRKRSTRQTKLFEQKKED